MKTNGSTNNSWIAYNLDIRELVANIEILTLEIFNNSRTDFIGIFEGDSEFAEVAQELRAEREFCINGI